MSSLWETMVSLAGAITGGLALVSVVLKVGGERQKQTDLEERMEKVEARVTDTEKVHIDMAAVKTDISYIKTMVADQSRQIGQVLDHVLRSAEGTQFRRRP